MNLNPQCPNCGSLDVIQGVGSLKCNYCGFIWNDKNAVNYIPNTAPPQQPQDDGIVIRNISIGKVKKSKGDVLFYNEKESHHSDNVVITKNTVEFSESGGRIFHTNEDACAVCHSCAGLIFRDEFARCSICGEPLCAKHRRTSGDGKVYCNFHFWLSCIARFLFLIVKIPLIILREILSVIFLKEKAN